MQGLSSGGNIAEQLAVIATLLQAAPASPVRPSSQRPQQAATASFHTAATTPWDERHAQVARSFSEPLAGRPAASAAAPALQWAAGGPHSSAFQPYGALPASAVPTHSAVPHPVDVLRAAILGNPSAGALQQALLGPLCCGPTIPLHRAASEPVLVPHAGPAAAPSYHGNHQEQLLAARQLLQDGILAHLCSLLPV